MQTWVKVAIIVGLTLIPGAAVVIYGLSKDNNDSATPIAGDYKEIDWRTLRGLDLKTGNQTPALIAIADKPVKIPGFVVPLDDDAASYSEFLLVPSPQACIHVPPPPANQMVMVRMRGSKAPQRSWGPVWVMGTLHVASTDSQYGKISYMLYGDNSEPYRMPAEPSTPPPPMPTK